MAGGDSITVTVYRSGSYQDLTVTLDEKKPEAQTTSNETAVQEPQAQLPNGWSFFN